MQLIDIIVALKGARSLIASGWCRNAVARDAKGRELRRVDDQTATQWCAGGALHAVVRDWNEAQDAVRYLRMALGDRPVPRWNDRAEDRSVVLAGFDMAIDKAIGEFGMATVAELEKMMAEAKAEAAKVHGSLKTPDDTARERLIAVGLEQLQERHDALEAGKPDLPAPALPGAPPAP